jgi:hypothetical protein
MVEELRVARSARRHRIGVAHMLVALENESARALEGDTVRIIGRDDRGVELELLLVPNDRGTGWTIIHAMPTLFRRKQ